MNTPGKLTVRSQHDDCDQLLISVMDTGAGVPPEKIEEIFDAFFTSKPQGTGMGLAISVHHRVRRRAPVGQSQRGTGCETLFHLTYPTQCASSCVANAPSSASP
ncbi:MAG TPA: ATP-binding protein [Candidatus Sulfotelmatobacter sp.]|nr:ATP-binding protein [Candidatus Sulfotelmatobacter sp.]